MVSFRFPADDPEDDFEVAADRIRHVAEAGAGFRAVSLRGDAQTYLVGIGLDEFLDGTGLVAAEGFRSGPHRFAINPEAVTGFAEQELGGVLVHLEPGHPIMGLLVKGYGGLGESA